MSDHTRRRFLGGLGTTVVAAGLTAGLAACGSDGDKPAAGASSGSASSGAAPTASASAAGWSYTDDRGKTVHLDRKPTRIALLTDTVTSALWAAGTRPVAAYSSDKDTETSVGLDIPKQHIIQLGTTDFQFKLEELVAAKPDLLVDAVQADGTLQTISTTPKAGDLAPVVGLNVYQPVDAIIGSADKLTSAIGFPLADAAAKADYLSAVARLREAVRSRPGVRVAFVFDMGTDKIGVMNPATWSVLKTLKSLGVTLVQIPNTKANQYSMGVSWENVPQIPADLLVWGVPDPLPTNPLWAKTPAVHAGQLWNPTKSYWYSYSWAVYADLFGDLADRISAAKAGVGPKGTLS